MYGLSDDEIAAIRGAQFEAFTPAEVALLRMADAMADTPSNVSDELYQELRHISEEQLIELAATAALENLVRDPDPCVRCGERRFVSQRAEVQRALDLVQRSAAISSLPRPFPY